MLHRVKRCAAIFRRFSLPRQLLLLLRHQPHTAKAHRVPINAIE